ncbi:MAG: ABC transporter permease [Candidatus Goldbacteria bacterium]|nr:ABC transporter permease [Candidatus Goldiibacteriota bacterium]
MFFFLKLAYGNITKNIRNSLTIIIAVFISVFFMEFTIGYMDGFKMKLLKEGLDLVGHVKVYNKMYKENLDFSPVEYNIPINDGIMEKIKTIPGFKDVRAEINFGVLASTGDLSQETLVKAIDLSRRDEVYAPRVKNIRQGRYPSAENEIAIGYKMAQILKVKEGDSLVLFGLDSYGGMNAVEGVITGIFNNFNPPEDEKLVLCSLELAQRFLGIEGTATELFVNLNDSLTAKDAAKALREKLPPEYTVNSWEDEQPMLVYAFQSMDVATFIICAIILVAAAFGIVNSFLMNIMGRMPEFGVLRAMGVSRLQLVLMILSESFALGLIGTAAGMLPSVAIVAYFQKHPINYEKMGDMMESMGGIDAMIGTALTFESAAAVFVTGVLISVAASLYPALSAARRKPVEILRVLE